VDEVLLLMTDGVTEALDPIPSPDTESKLAQTIAAGPRNVHDLVRELLSALDGLRPGQRQDDVAVLGLQLARL
jgi:serine phosphatase RsbU (regulator of sigma subunit)